MTDIYDQHSKAFQHVSAYVICKDGKQVGNIAFKYPRDGAGRLYCYLHIHGNRMVRGFAGGYGYDKQSAAASSAAEQMTTVSTDGEHAQAVINALLPDDGFHWDGHLIEAGFDVFGAV